MKLSDFTKLKGLMALSNSDNDHEALGAIRAANRLLVTNALTWEMVFSRTVKVVNEVEADANDPDDELTDMFDKALLGAQGSFRDTILDIQSKYQTSGYLSPRQRQVVEDAAERYVERHGGGRVR